MYKIIFCSFILAMLNGCYTQMAFLEEPSQIPAPKISYEIDSATGDTVKVMTRLDTIARTNNQNCYWTRNLWGQAELRCDNSNYSQDWYLYNDYPWWYHRDSYMYDAYGRCPQYYYYDESCRSCRYYTDRGFSGGRIGRSGGGGGQSYSGGTTNSGSIRYNRSSGVPDQSTIRTTPQTNLLKQQNNAVSQGTSGSPNSSAATQAQEPSRRTRSSGVPSSSTVNESAPVNLNPVVETRTQAQVPVYTPPPQPMRESSPPPQDQPNTNMQSSPPPSSPSSNSGDQNNNRNRRNPRSW